MASVADKKFKTRLTVAVVDDDPELVRSVTLMLRVAGADVVEAITGISGYLLVRRTILAPSSWIS